MFLSLRGKSSVKNQNELRISAWILHWEFFLRLLLSESLIKNMPIFYFVKPLLLRKLILLIHSKHIAEIKIEAKLLDLPPKIAHLLTSRGQDVE